MKPKNIVFTEKPKSLEILENNPEIFLKMFNEVEYKIVQTLYHATHGVNAREMQRRIVMNELSKWLRKEQNKAVEFFEKLKRDSDPEGKKRKEALISDIKQFYEKMLSESERLPLTKFLKEARKYVDVPAYTTIERSLNNLVSQGLIGKRQGKSSIYFLHPKLYLLLKNFHKSVDFQKINGLWKDFFIYPN